MSKEDELIEYARQYFPNVRVRTATEEEKRRFGQHRLYVGKHPPVVRPPQEREEGEDTTP